VAFGRHSFTYLDFADDLSLLAELLELLVPILETMASEAASLGLDVNWQKTKVQGWRGGLVVGRRTCDLEVAGSRHGRDAATTLGKFFTPYCLCHKAV